MKKYLLFLSFCAGAGALGLELSAARLLEPWFGNSQLVWSALIAMVLAFLAGGAWLGGRWGDRHPTLPRLLATVLAAGWLTSLIPLLAPSVLRMAAHDLLAFEAAALLAAGASILVLLGLPVLLLGAVTPWAVRIALPSVAAGGRTVGQFHAASAVGSIAGALAPALWLIPAAGTRLTFFLLAMLVAASALAGLPWLTRSRQGLAAFGSIVLLWAAVWPLATDTSSIRGLGSETAAGTLIYEDESRHNYIAVRRQGSETYLKLNEGVGIHSVRHPDSLLSQGIWDYFLLAPWCSSNPPDPARAEVLIIGLAAGTVSSLWSEIYGPAPITGVELDPQILEVGAAYFGLERPNVTAEAGDGRRWLQSQPPDRRWDMIGIDAYRVPYIPFQLATTEFFDLVRSRLTSGGAAAINVGRVPGDQRLVDSLVVTLQSVFPTVFVFDEPAPPGTLGNSLVVGLPERTEARTCARHLRSLALSYPEEFRAFAAAADPKEALPVAGLEPLTDDRAPIAQIVHGMVWRFLQERA